MTDFLLRHGWPLLASVAVKSLFVLALAGGVVLALRRASAAARHLVWSLALIGLLLLPVFSSSLPAFWQVPLGSRALLVTPDAPTLTPSSPIPNSAGENRPPAPNSGGAGLVGSGETGSVYGRPAGSPLRLPPPELGAGGRSLPWQVWVCGIWLAGAVLTLLPSLIGLAGVRRLTRRSSSVTVGPLPELTTELAQSLGVRAPVRLLLGEAGTPMTWGWLRPVILLPLGADQWPSDRLRAVLLHELAHIARADWPAQMASHLACALYWFNPLVWLAARQARTEGERACDDRVLLAGIPAPDYARHLLDVARSLRDTPLPAVLPMAKSSHVEGRLRAILQPRRRQTMLTKRMLWLGGGIALLVLLPLTAIRPGPAQPPPDGAAASTPPALAWQAPLPAGTTVAPPSQEVTLPNGIQVKLLGFAQNPSRNVPWSAPDGRAGIKSPYLYGNEIEKSPMERSVEFAVYLDGLRRIRPGAVSFAALPAPQALGGGRSCNITTYVRWGNSFPPGNLQAVVASFPKTGNGLQTGAFLFGVADGPWQTATAKQYMDGVYTGSAQNTDAAILVSTSRDLSRPLIVSVADDAAPSVETRIVAVDRRGALHTPETLDGGGSGTTSFSGVHSLDEAIRSYHNIHQSLVTFPGLPLRDVREVRFQTRPYQWVLFKNLALYPNLTSPAGKP